MKTTTIQTFAGNITNSVKKPTAAFVHALGNILTRIRETSKAVADPDAVRWSPFRKTSARFDKKYKQTFLVDTDAQVSVLPRSFAQTNAQSELQLYAANETRISTYGKKQLQLDLGFNRRMSWTFYVADVPNPNLGAEFIAGQKLLVDPEEKVLIDKESRQSVKGTLGHAPLAGIRIATVTFESPVTRILHEFP